MCGIVGYIGNREAVPILMKGLRQLEYRGYDSAGIAVMAGKRIIRTRSVGKIQNMESKFRRRKLRSNVGIGHTRWATHGGITEQNAHPHSSFNREIILVHNGIIENYRELKKSLGSKYKYASETDTEVLANLIEKYYLAKPAASGLLAAVKKALERVRGTYGIVVMAKSEPDMLIAARLGSPIVVGIGEDEHYIASDPVPIMPYTQRMMFLDDGDIVEISGNGVVAHNLERGRITKRISKIDCQTRETSKGRYRDFMLKEIFEQPEVFQDAIRGRIDESEGISKLGGINMTEREARGINRVIFIACGTAMYASMVGKYLFEKFARLPTEVDIASEFRYRNPVINKRTLVFAVSQSGETADTLAAAREAKRQGGCVRGIVNVVGSTIARELDGGTYIHAGPELAVASTKAYTNMLAIICLYALYFGRLRGMNIEESREILGEMKNIPRKMRRIFARDGEIKRIAKKYKDYRDFLFLGRGLNYPVALEGSLKLKEISYIHSEGYAAGEMKHGANALLAPACPVVAVVTKNSSYDKMRSNIAEVRARKSKVIGVATERDKEINDIVDDIIYVPKTSECLEPLLNTVPLQMFAYHTAHLLGRDIDRPRNLAKSVTVE